MNGQEITDERISELLSGLDDNVEIPFDVSAGWKLAVRKDARRAKINRFAVRFTELAASLLLLVGLTAVMRAGGNVPIESEKVREHYFHADSVFESSMVYFAPDGEEDELFTSGAVEDNAVLLTSGSDDLSDSAAAGDSNDEPVIIRYAQADISGNDIQEGGRVLQETVEGFNAYFETEVINKNNGIEKYSATIRIKSDELDAFTQRLSEAFDNINVTVHTADVSSMIRDAGDRLTNAYLAVDKLAAMIENDSGDNVYRYYGEMNAIYDEIDTLTTQLTKYDTDSEYSQVYVTISETTNNGSFLGTVFDNLFDLYKPGASFALDMIKTLALILPVIALSTLIAIGIYKRKSGRTVFNRHVDS